MKTEHIALAAIAAYMLLRKTDRVSEAYPISNPLKAAASAAAGIGVISAGAGATAIAPLLLNPITAGLTTGAVATAALFPAIATPAKLMKTISIFPVQVFQEAAIAGQPLFSAGAAALAASPFMPAPLKLAFGMVQDVFQKKNNVVQVPAAPAIIAAATQPVPAAAVNLLQPATALPGTMPVVEVADVQLKHLLQGAGVQVLPFRTPGDTPYLNISGKGGIVTVARADLPIQPIATKTVAQQITRTSAAAPSTAAKTTAIVKAAAASKIQAARAASQKALAQMAKK